MSNILDSIKSIILSNLHHSFLGEFNAYTDSKPLPVFRDGMNNQYITYDYMFGYVDNPCDLFPIVENNKDFNLDWSNIIVKYSNNILYRYSITSFISEYTNEIKYAVIRDYCHENDLSSEENYMGVFTYHLFDSVKELESFIINNINYNKGFINFHHDLNEKFNMELDTDILYRHFTRFSRNTAKYMINDAT